MIATVWKWLWANWGNLASVFGLVASSIALFQAKWAKEAAKEAALVVRVRNLSHNFSEWSIDAQGLLQEVRESRFEIAQRSATNLLGDLSHNSGWRSELKKDAPTVDLSEVIRLLGLVNTFLSEREVFEGNQTKISKYCQTIFLKLKEASGKIDAAVEKQ